MKYRLPFLSTLPLLALLLTGCSTVRTSGVYNENLQEKKPYSFSYDGSSGAAAASLRKVLLPKGFSVESKDEYDGGASYVFSKTLSDNERFETTGFYEGMTGTSTGNQSGKLVFLFTSNEDGTVSAEMTPRIVMQMRQQQNAVQTSSKETEAQVPQGHPLPMKFARQIAQTDGWQLKSPSRSAVFTSSK